MYSGPLRKVGGFGSFCESNDIACDYVDKEYNDAHDLLDQQTWEDIEATLPQYDGFLMSPPCSTFTPARNGHDGGPGPLRTTEGPERYGRKNVTPHEKERVRQGTLLAKRAHVAAEHATREDKPWILEQPHWRPGKTSMFMLDEFQELLSDSRVNLFTLAQCRFGADVEKLTDLLSNRDLSDLELKCNHPSRWWRVPWNGERFYGPHPPLRGKQKAIAEEDWHPSMMRGWEPEGPYITRAYAAYPDQLNKALADKLAKLVQEDKSNVTPTSIAQQPSTVRDQAVETQFVMNPKLRKQSTGKTQDDDKWSLRNLYSSMTARAKLIGKQIGNLIERELDAASELESRIFDNFGKAASDVYIPEQWLNDVRLKLADLLQRNRVDGQSEICDTLPINNSEHNTVLRGHLLEYWAQVVGDPAAKVARWLYNGAPAGLNIPMDLQDICPEVEDDSPELDEIELSTDYANFVNYEGVETNQDASAAIGEYHRKGYLERFESLADTQRYLGDNPVLSKLGCIVKEKMNWETGMKVKKTRIILDCKRSQVSKFASRQFKSVLPRVSDAVQSALKLAQVCKDDEAVSLFIADVSDAFWLIPLHKAEQKFFVATLHKRFYVFKRTAQGSRGAPLTFSAVMSLLTRFVQSILCTTKARGNVPEGFMQVYVDDPLTVIRGTKMRQRRLSVMISVAWMLLGVPMAFHKAVLSDSVTWIGVSISVTLEDVIVEVTEAKVKEILQIITETLLSNVIAIKTLRTLIGKCMSIASVIYVWKPFVQEMYAALHGPTQAPNGCIWTRQIQHSLVWLAAFLQEEAGTIKRQYSVAQFQPPVIRVQITWDASPYGMGAFITIDGKVKQHFAIPISKDDEEILQAKSGGCEAQQVWECLAGLIAMRLWTPFWKQSRVHLHLRGDNISSLVLFSTLKTHSKQLAVIAREFALDLGTACFKPEVAQHVPGIANTVADMLSRKFDPNKQYFLHPCLAESQEVTPPARPIRWWRSLRKPIMPVSPDAEDRAWSNKRPRLIQTNAQDIARQ